MSAPNDGDFHATNAGGFAKLGGEQRGVEKGGVGRRGGFDDDVGTRTSGGVHPPLVRVVGWV